MKFLLSKFARQENLSKESKGGSYEHNAKMIPFLIHLVLILQNKENTPEKNGLFKSAIERFFKKPSKDLTSEHFYLITTLSLFAFNAPEFSKNKMNLIELAIMLGHSKKEEKLQKNIRDITIFKNGENFNEITLEKLRKEMISNYFENNMSNESINSFLIKIKAPLVMIWILGEVMEKLYGGYGGDVWVRLEEEIGKNYDKVNKI